METGRQSSNTDHDPAAALDLLSRATSFTDVDYLLDFGPFWYAPLLSLTIGGTTLAIQGSDEPWRIALFVVGLISLAIVAVHDHRRRRVRVRTSGRGLGMFVLILAICWILIAAWGAAVSSIGVDEFVPAGAVVGWVLTTAALLGVRAIFLGMRRRRTPLP